MGLKGKITDIFEEILFCFKAASHSGALAPRSHRASPRHRSRSVPSPSSSAPSTQTLPAFSTPLFFPPLGIYI